jgi:hypothetical protein
VSMLRPTTESTYISSRKSPRVFHCHQTNLQLERRYFSPEVTLFARRPGGGCSIGNLEQEIFSILTQNLRNSAHGPITYNLDLPRAEVLTIVMANNTSPLENEESSTSQGKDHGPVFRSRLQVKQSGEASERFDVAGWQARQDIRIRLDATGLYFASSYSVTSVSRTSDVSEFATNLLTSSITLNSTLKHSRMSLDLKLGTTL